jgi:integrase/recombinase XerD
MGRTVYAAPFDITVGRRGWVVVRAGTHGLERVQDPSDWLLARASTAGSSNTLKSQAETAAQWWRWCEATSVDPLRVDSTTLARYVIAMQTVPKAYELTSEIRALPGDPRLRRPSTVRLRLMHLRAFYAWADAEGRVSAVTAKAVGAFKAPRVAAGGVPSRMDREQVGLLRTVTLSPRDRLVVELLYGAGLREGEALGLYVEDVCLNREIAAVFGCRVRGGPHLHVRRRINSNGALAKSPYERVVPLGPRIITAYRDWQAWVYEHLPLSLECPFLVTTLAGPTRGGGWSLSGFASMWTTRVQSIEGLEDVTPHICRHTFASELVDAGVPAFTVQELLGHRSPSSTQIYTHAHMDTLVRAVQQLADWRDDRVGVTG